MTTVAVTGHRPGKLWGYDLSDPHYAVVSRALSVALDQVGATRLISGMALGFDTVAAHVALRDGIPLTAAVPFKGQESKWGWASQWEYRQLLEAADEIEYVTSGGYTPYAMAWRNEWMVKNADVVLALWDGSKGGTKNTVDHAIKLLKPVWTLDPADVTEKGSPGFQRMYVDINRDVRRGETLALDLWGQGAEQEVR